MPAIKQLMGRTIRIKSATMNPIKSSTKILSSQGTAATLCTPTFNIFGGRCTLATIASGGGCARLGCLVAHVNKTTPTNINIIKPKYIRKRVLMFCSSSSYQERENQTHKLHSTPPLMGAQNDGVLRTNGVVSSNPNNNNNKEKGGEEECTKLLTLPTVLTLARVAAVPLFISTYYSNSWWGAAATTSIFVGAAITDWLDGYLARKMRQGTAFGAFLDPVADKLMVAATLVLLCSKPPENALYGNYPWLLPVPAIAIIGREITMSAVREWAASQDAKLLQAVAVNNLGKWKTATQMTALTIILATRDSSVSSQGALATSGVGLLYISAGLALWSLIVYMRKIWKVLLR